VFVKIETSIYCSLFIVKFSKFFSRNLDVVEFINNKGIAKKIIKLLCFSCSFYIFLQEVIISIDNFVVNIRSLKALNNLLL